MHWRPQMHLSYNPVEVAEEYATARQCVDACLLAWLTTPMRHDGAMDFAFACAQVT